MSLAIALVQMVLPLVGAHKGWDAWMGIAVPAALAQCVLLTGAFAALVWLFVTSDFSLAVVAANSHSAKPLLYKISGTWGNHEGSLLLWVLILALFGALIALFGVNLPQRLKARVLAVQASIGVAFLAFLIWTSNPFERLNFPPFDGGDLNPLLQDPGLAFHPPFLYLGYVGLSVAFSFAVAALIEGRVDAAWARWVRPWTLAAWMFLTIGIGMGSWWAYYELGWGGWWFWDPVENASFMPWLIAAALLHSAIVVEKRDTLKSWTVLLAILAFSFSLVGTFIVRSGVITSVHAFANDPTRGVAILGILAVFCGGAFTLFAWRATTMRPGGVFSLVSRESGLVLNNLLLTVSCFVVLLGTIWPLVAEPVTWALRPVWAVLTDLVRGLGVAMGPLREGPVTVGPPFYEIAFTPFMVLLILALPIGTLLPWKRAGRVRLGARLWPFAALAVAVAALVYAVQTGRSALAPLGTALGVWVLGGVVADLVLRVRAGEVPAGDSMRRLARLPRGDWGRALAHGGLGVLVIGIAMIEALTVEDIRLARPGDVIEIQGTQIRFDGVERVQGPNYWADRGTFTLLDGAREVAVMQPEKRVYPVAEMPTTEAAIRRAVHRDLYLTLGDPFEDGWAVRTWIKPFANWLWAGMILMSLGGLVSLTDRRYRVGVAQRAAPRPNPVPAE